MADENEQQYVEVGSNMYLGTKDGMKYTLVQTSDSKFRLVEAFSDSNMSFDSVNRSLTSSAKEENTNKLPTRGSKLIKLMAVKSETSPCKGQGDEIGNSVLSSSASFSSFNESDSAVEKISFTEASQDFDNNLKPTYTTLLSKEENAYPLQNYNVQRKISYSTPQNVYYNYPSSFTAPLTMRRARGSRRPCTRFLPAGSSCSPIRRPRGRTPRGGRPRKSTYQYNPQVLHSTPSSMSSFYSDPQLSSSISLGENHSTISFNQSPISIEYPKVPNNTPNSSELTNSSGNQDIFSLQWMPPMSSQVENYISADPRELHNENERKRRLRIKYACQYMKPLLPGVSDKTDNATVFEHAVNFINFMRNTVGNQSDMEFMEEMCSF